MLSHTHLLGLEGIRKLLLFWVGGFPGTPLAQGFLPPPRSQTSALTSPCCPRESQTEQQTPAGLRAHGGCSQAPPRWLPAPRFRCYRSPAEERILWSAPHLASRLCSLPQLCLSPLLFRFHFDCLCRLKPLAAAARTLLPVLLSTLHPRNPQVISKPVLFPHLLYDKAGEGME